MEDMRAALRGDRERAEQARRRSRENVRVLIETPVDDVQQKPGLFQRLFDRLVGR